MKTEASEHLLRATPNNLSRLIVLTQENQDPSENGRKKRVGRPHYTWLQESLKEAWLQYRGREAGNFIQERDFPELLEQARRRAPPF